ncbi:A/G-specific adenine glycosylase [Cysteiniphilum sp. QT6929]|uniref:A/G-specific adenine glycosylase n=1 Tax=Cysteiniphilum sp. QT6929 TaxID=2975055 RepID=UPI0024B3422D|nr:A/G-specific adenine glycosylase [Cysteiniphilum sp. QT6929]WHN66252.1 A/G-specific adenine glycosylase [Cysteiniphilum sp. QT6929]
MTEIKLHFNISHYQSALLTWFSQSGRHDLPWQGDFNPYHVWLSEIMLQQTQVKTVIPYFLKFIDRFPHISDLAQADQDEVMQYWAGLGYYARARNLHKTAQVIYQKHSGVMPDSVDHLLALPGIGKSTAHAILSIAFKQATPIMDGNVKRVFARVFAIDEVLSGATIEKKLWQLAHKLMPKDKTQNYTQAQMDLGATICIRTKPKCGLCPLQDICLSFANERVDQYPRKKEKKVKPVQSAVFHLYQYQDELLLIKKPNKGIWGGLYALPESALNIGEYSHMLCEEQKHIFTHFELYYDIKVYQLTQKATIDNAYWVSKDNIKKYALPAPLAKHLIC